MKRIKRFVVLAKRFFFLVRHSGIRYAFHCVHFYIFWNLRLPLLRRYLYAFEPFPSYLEIEVTTRCNLKCLICEHTYWNEPNKDMSFEEFVLIVDQFPHLKMIGLTGIGESFLNRDFLRMLAYVKAKDVFVELYDTFFFIDEKTARELIAISVDRIFVSLDAATKQTYEKIRACSDFERVTQNVRRLFLLRRQLQSGFPEINFHYIVNKENYHEILPYLKLVYELSGGVSTTIQFTRMLHSFAQIEKLFTEIPGEIIHKVEEEAGRLGIRVVWNEDVPEKKPPIHTCIEWTMPFIFVTGHVIPCCSGNEAGQRDFQKEHAMGNVFETPFARIWRGQRYTALRRQLMRGKVPVVCRNCCIYRKDR